MLGARLTGAGFGGCAIALVDATRVESFAATVAPAYQERTHLQPRTIVTPPSATSRVAYRVQL